MLTQKFIKLKEKLKLDPFQESGKILCANDIKIQLVCKKYMFLPFQNNVNPVYTNVNSNNYLIFDPRMGDIQFKLFRLKVIDGCPHYIPLHERNYNLLQNSNLELNHEVYENADIEMYKIADYEYQATERVNKMKIELDEIEKIEKLLSSISYYQFQIKKGKNRIKHVKIDPPPFL